MRDLTIHPLGGSASSMAHRPISSWDTIYNSPSPPLADIVLFRLSLKVFKMRLLGRDFHILIRNVSFSSPIDVRCHTFKEEIRNITNPETMVEINSNRGNLRS